MQDVPADELPCGLVRLDGAGVIVEANTRFATWAGTPATALAGLPLRMFVPDSVESGAIAMLTGADGRPRPVLVARTADGRTVMLYDGESRQRYEQEQLQLQSLTQRTRVRLQLVIDAAIAFAAVGSESELAALLADTAAQAYAAEESVVLLRDDTDGYVPVAGRSPLDGFDVRELLALPAFRMGQVIKLSGIEQAAAIGPALRDAFAASGVESLILSPISHEDVPLGAYACFFLHPRQFDEQASPLASALSGQAGQVITTLRLQRRLRHAATHDETTGLPNRRMLEQQLRGIGARSRPLAVVFIDLDGFKAVNDRLGHPVGDRLLQEIGQRLQDAAAGGDIVARYGGDEFVVVGEVDDAAAGGAVAERLRACVEGPFASIPSWLTVAASVGVALAGPDEDVTMDALIRAADQAMYRAKSAGGNRVVAA